MIKFEEHDGMLFKMLDKPVPLAPDTEMPCLVRLIQDDSPMGKHNKDLHGFDPERLTPRICTEIIDINDLSDPNRGSARCDGFISGQYYHYELIGTPVVEGSAEWRNYQLVQGKCVYRPGDSEYYQASGQGRIIGKLIENNEFNSTWNSNTFMRDDSDGWEIYKEPKPETAKEQFEVGDWVELNVYNNHQGQIKKMFPAGMGELCGTRIHRTEPTFLITGLSGEFHYDTITRKLSPSEVIVHIGCMSGTVRRINDIFFCLNPSTEKGWVVPEATIPLAMLDTPTRKIVESLLKAQEEEK